MAIVIIMCPQTGKQVSTGVEMDRTGFNALSYSRRFVFHCWLCGREHEWSKRWASLPESLSRHFRAYWITRERKFARNPGPLRRSRFCSRESGEVKVALRFRA